MIRGFSPTELIRLSVASTLAAAIWAGSATEAVAQPNAMLVTNVPVTGVTIDSSTDEESTFSGTLSLSSINFDASTTDTLIIVGNITGTDFLEQLFTTTGTITALGGQKNKCGLVNLNLSPATLDLLGVEARLDEISIDVSASRGKARNLGNQLCKLSRFIAKADRNQVNKITSKINGIISNPLKNVAVTGTANNTGTFNGFVTIEGFQVDVSGDIVVTGHLSGAATVDGAGSVITGHTFSTTASLSGTSFGFKGKKCDTLLVDLGTISVPDQELEIDMGEVAVQTGAEKATGKKTAKSLCKIVKILDKQDAKPMDLFKLIKKLTKQMGKLNQLLLP